MTGKMPYAVFVFGRPNSAPAVRRIFAAPYQSPGSTFGRRQKRLRKYPRRQVATEIHDEQSILAGRIVEANQKRLVRKCGRIQTSPRLLAEKAVAPLQPDEVTMKTKHGSIAFTLRPVEHAALECRGIVGSRKIDRTQARKLRQKFAPSLGHRAGKILTQICKEQKRRCGCEFFPLKKHGNARRQQQESGRRPQVSGFRQADEPLAGAGVGNLIMVLEKIDALERVDVQRRASPAVALPCRALAL